MKRRIISFLTAVVSAGCILTSCGKTRLDGKYELCTADGQATGIDIRFKDDGKITFNGDKYKFEVLNANTIKIKGIDDLSLSDEFTFDIVDEDEKLIYIEGVSEKFLKRETNVKASILYKAVNAAIVELDEKDIFLDGINILCSDNSKTIFGSDSGKNAAQAAEDINKYSHNFWADMDDYDYIIVMNDGVCIAAAVSEKSGKIAGTYPADKVIDVRTGADIKTYESKDTFTLADIYKQYKEQIK